MTATLRQLIESLRNELQQYGEMLALLEAQQDVVASAGTSSLLSTLSAIEAQSLVLDQARRTREKSQRQLAWSLACPELVDADTRPEPLLSPSNGPERERSELVDRLCLEILEKILPRLSEEYRPLVTALVEEIQQLLARVRERARRNFDQLRRATGLMELFLQTLSPEGLSARSSGEIHSTRAEHEPPLAVSGS